MSPLLVHVHVFYPDLWPELRDCLLNIAHRPFELFVTCVERHEEVESDIKAHFPAAHIGLVENRGYDIAPFLHVLSRVNLDDYSYVIKLHTKRDVAFFSGKAGSRSEWRELLLAFMKTRERFDEHLAAFEANPRIGMQADYRTHIVRDIYDNESVRHLNQWLAEHGLPKRPFTFVGGTMFIARASLLKAIQGYGFQPQDFPESRDHRAQLAHIVERLLGYFIYSQGYLLSDRQKFEEAARYQRKLRMQRLLSQTVRFFYQEKITRSGKKTIKVLRIPVYRGRVRQGRN